MTQQDDIGPGQAAPLGAHFDGDGVNFAVFSDNATRMTLCLFSDDGTVEERQIDLPERDGGVWHGYVPGLRPGAQYGYRADGPYAPHEGHRFNANKLLIDPYARKIKGHPNWHDAVYGYVPGHAAGHRSFSTLDSAPYVPRSVVCAPPEHDGHVGRPDVAKADTVIYEAHVKGVTQLMPGVDRPGTFTGLASDPMLDHLTALGITAIELLPAQAFVNDRFLVEKKLVNYWGYQTLGFFAPEPRYLHDGDIREFRRMVDRFHGAGIEVLMDVVYNHSCEGDALGPTLSFRGLDNASYYRLAHDRAEYSNDTGTGNAIDLSHPMVLRMVMDSLRYWVEVMGVDGFRFDLCATLGRTAQGFDPGAAFFDALRQDPVLAQVKLIAEPWDIGPGGYQLGNFPSPFMEWNDRFRDGVRQFWRGDAGMVPELADRITGSARLFDHSGRSATTSVNKITSHDGFTLMDVVSYIQRHNRANGEGNRDGHDANYTDNMGTEGPSRDPDVFAARTQRRRNLMATLLLSQGTPLILAGDEAGNSQGGNNNAYCQDNAISWIDWQSADADFMAFTKRLISFRKAHPILRQKRFLHARERDIDGIEDLFWWRADGTPMQVSDWQDARRAILCAEMRTASGTPAYAQREDALFLIFNAGDEENVTLPDAPPGQHWSLRIDTTRPDLKPGAAAGDEVTVPANAVLAFSLIAETDFTRPEEEDR